MFSVLFYCTNPAERAVLASDGADPNPAPFRARSEIAVYKKHSVKVRIHGHPAWHTVFINGVS